MGARTVLLLEQWQWQSWSKCWYASRLSIMPIACCPW